MLLLILGLFLWSGLHILRRRFPERRAALSDRFGSVTPLVMYGGVILSIVLMVIGYRSAPFITVWTPPSFMGHVNNLLMLLAFYVYFQTATKPGTAWIMGNLKHPQLTGFKIWAIAHLLSNGDLASLILFGGLLGWAVYQVILSKSDAPSLVDRETAKIASPVVHAGLSLGVFVVVAFIHMWLGVNPFGGV